MKRTADYKCVDDNGAPLKKHEEDHDARITRIREEIVIEQQAIASLHVDLDKRQQRLAQLENELEEAFRAKERDLQQEREAFELATQRIAMAVSPNKIDLNVGGRVFSVKLEVLLKYPDSFFGRLFSGRWEDQIGADGAYFIDRSFTHFHHIIDFLRNGCLDVELSESDHRCVERRISIN
jgi:hypothetical protein